MKRKRDEPEETQEGEQETLSPKELKKLQQKASVQKRRDARKRDKVARWGGLILLGLMMFVGFLLWVAGEMKAEKGRMEEYRVVPTGIKQNSVIVK